MGFLNSLINSIFGKTVDEAVSKVVDKAINNIDGNNDSNTQGGQNVQYQSGQYDSSQYQSAPVQPAVGTIIRPNLTGKLQRTEEYTFMDNQTGDSVYFSYELPDNLYEEDACAAEIPICYAVAHSAEEHMQYADEILGKLPCIYFCDDGNFDDNIKKMENVVCTKIEGHPLIEERYEYDDPRSKYPSHEIAYKFYNTEGNKALGIATELTLMYSIDKVDKTLLPYAKQALDLIASTLTRE